MTYRNHDTASAIGDVLRSVCSLVATTDEVLGRPGETLRWLYSCTAGFPHSIFMEIGRSMIHGPTRLL